MISVFGWVVIMSSSALLYHAVKQQANKKVAIIGSGAAGLCVGDAFRQAAESSSSPSSVSFTLFEASSSTGGVWKQTKPMYRSLVTNLPVEIMEISQNDPFKKSSGSSFVGHREVNSYLEDFARDHHLMEHIKFDTLVTSVEPVYSEEANLKWRVSSVKTSPAASSVKKSIETLDEEVEVDVYDNVVICNGHYSKSFTPRIEGLEDYPGQSIHSMDYDSDTIREQYGGKRVLLLGARASAMDIAREITSVASSVYVSDRSYKYGELASRHYDGKLTHVGGVVRYNAGMFSFTDGSTAKDVDVIVYCTGYTYDFPFFNTKSSLCDAGDSGRSIDELDGGHKIVEVDQGRAVLDVYQHIFHHKYPSLAFVGLPWSVVPFHMFYLQARWIAKVYCGELPLHGEDERQSWLTDHAGE